MKLHKIRGGSLGSLESREYNICVGISLGNKWFTPENILELIKWSLIYTKEYIVICPADDIHAINIQIRSRKSPESALRLAKKMGTEIVASVKELTDQHLDDEQKSKLIFADWSDVADEKYKKKVNFLYEAFGSNLDFRNTVRDIVKEYTSKGDRIFSKEDIDMLSTYILEELPELIGRVPVKGYICDAYAYPFDGSLTKLVEDIQLGNKFPEIRNKILDTEPKVFLEVQ